MAAKKKSDDKAKLREANKKLRALRESSRQKAWAARREEEHDPNLPAPRLELAYDPVDGWRKYTVVYRLVMRHLLDHDIILPLGKTEIESNRPNEPDAEHMPLRDGAHAIHDAAHMRLPLYKIMPGRKPSLIDPAHHPEAARRGREHRTSP